MKYTFTFLILFFFISQETLCQFGEQRELTQSTIGASDAQAYDLDNDGDLDIVMSSYGDNKLAWYENLGGGVFSDQILISTSSNYIQGITAADLDNDGFLDLIATSKVDNKIVWYKNLGNGTFDFENIISSQVERAFDVEAADLNNDGLIDIISSSTLRNQLAWYKNLGNGNFLKINISTNNIYDLVDVKVADIDLDGNLDVFASWSSGAISTATSDQKVSWFKNDGTGSFGNEQVVRHSIPGLLQIHIDDIDLDSDIDFIITASNYTYWLENDGNGIFSEQILEYDSYMGYSTSFDYDNDGDIDIATIRFFGGPVFLYENLGNQTFGVRDTLIVQYDTYISSFHSCDINNDGYNELLGSASQTNSVFWYLNNADGTFGAQNLLSIDTYLCRRVYSSDLNGDGWNDVISVSERPSGIGLYYNLMNNNFTNQIVLDQTDEYTCAAFGDVDSDGDIDIIAGAYTSTVITPPPLASVTLYRNLGSGTFDTAIVVVPNWYDVSDIVLVDIDNDADLDIVMSTSFNIGVLYLLNDGGGNFSGPVPIESANNYKSSALDVADIDQDGNKDIVFGKYGGEVHVAFGDGVGNFTITKISGNNTDYPFDIKLIDLDQDGDEDILFAASSYYSSGNGTLCWYENHIDSIVPWTLHRIDQFTLGTNTIEYMDIENDGDIDIITESNRGEHIFTYINDGNQNFSLGNSIFNMQGYFYSYNDLYLEDLNNDGKKDLISGDLTGKVSWYENFGFCNNTSNFISYYPNDTVCLGDTILLTSDSLSGNTWLLNGNIVSNDTLYNLTESGTITVMVNNLNCVHSNEFYFKPLPTSQISYTLPSALCEGDSLTFFSDSLRGNFWYYYNVLTSIDSAITIYNSGLYVLQNEYQGCFSVPDSVNINFTINPKPHISSSNPSICADSMVILISDSSSGNNWILNNNIISSSDSVNITQTGFYYLENQFQGCIILSDSIDVSIKPVVNIIEGLDTLVCQNDSILLHSDLTSGNNWYYFDTLVSMNNSVYIIDSGMYYLQNTSAGCFSDFDSIVVGVKNVPNSYITVLGSSSICQGDQTILLSDSTSGNEWFLNDTLISNSNQLVINVGGKYVLINQSNGCQSKDSVNILVNQVYSVSKFQHACFYYISNNGDTLTASGSYIDTLTSIYGCDSIVTLQLLVDSINTTITQNGIELTSNESGAIYQWINCNTNQIIIGATSQNFFPTSNGNYAVQINHNFCTDTSSCYTISTVGLIESNFESDIIVYPNPTKGMLQLDLGDRYDKLQVKVLSYNGEIIKSNQISGQLVNLDLSELANGVYFLHLVAKDQKAILRVIKEE